MADDDLTKLLRERQRRAECEAAGIPYIPDEQAVRQAPHCDPEIPAVPDILLEPNTAPVITSPDRLLPPPLVIFSPEVTVDCVDHGGGAGTATSAAAESSIDLYLDDIDTLTRSELYRTADNFAALQAALTANLEDLVSGAISDAAFDAAIMAASTMEATAAAGIRAKAVELRGGPDNGSGATGLYAIAELTALSRLVCLFYSAEVWVVCDSNSDTGFTPYYTEPAPLPAVDRYRYRAAGFATSTVSVADATELAELDAVSDPTFECVYVSEAFPVTCGDDVDPVFDHTYVPAFTWEGLNYNTLEELGAANFSSYALDSLTSERLLVYTVTTPAGLFPSASQAEANDRAKTFALRQLNCFFPSREAEVNCANRSLDNAVLDRMVEAGLTEAQVFEEMDSEYGVDPDLVTNQGLLALVPGPGAEIDTSEGLIVQLPAGLAVSLTNQDDADTEARLHALGFLSCRWVSPATECDCFDWYTQLELDALNVTLNTQSSSAGLSFEKGALGSSEDGPIPVEDALALCKASLTCIYCNKTKDPKCHIAYDEGGLSYDLWAPQTDAELPLTILTKDGVSTGVSAGLPADVICDADPALVDTLAEATGNLPPPVIDGNNAPVCRYGNREVVRTCEDKVGVNAFALTPESQLRTLTVSTGSFEADTQVAADALAEAFINAALICEFGNPPMTVLCGATADSSPVVEADYTVPKTYGDGRAVVDPAATGGVGTPLAMVAHVFTSIESPRSARAAALLSLITELDCFWTSVQVDLVCSAPPGLADSDPLLLRQQPATIEVGVGGARYAPNSTGDVLGEVTLAAGSVVSYINQKDANRQAYALTFAQLDCFWESAKVDVLCGAANVVPPAEIAYNETQTITAGAGGARYAPNSNGDVLGEVTSASAEVVSYLSQEDANRKAFSLAFDQLDCFWESARVDLRCGADATLPVAQEGLNESETIVSGANAGLCSPDSNGDAPGEVFVAAEEVVSYLSQKDANRQAYALAYGQLDCFWQSAAVNLRCTAPANMPGLYDAYQVFQEIREGDVQVGPPREPLGNSTFSPESTGYSWDQVVVDAATVTSYLSQAEANRQAYRLAWPQLDCFFHSAQVILSCVPARFPTDQQLLIGPAGTISGGGGSDSMSSAPGTITSYHNQANANMQAYQITRSQLGCDGGKDHAYGVTGSGTFACCKVKFDDLMLDSGLATFYSPKEAGEGLENIAAKQVPGYEEVAPDTDGAEKCGEFPAYFYLEADLHKRTGAIYAQYYSTFCEVKVYDSEQPLLEGQPGSYNKARRLLAYANQEDPNSTFNRDAKDDCADLKIVQVVTCAQKLTSSDQGGTVVPYITDLDSPLGGGSSGLPFDATLAGDTEMTVLGGYYQVGVEGDWVEVPGQGPTEGNKAYLQIIQDGARNVTSVALLIQSTALTPVEVSPGGDYVESNVLLAEAVAGANGDLEIRQRRNGNFNLTIWQIDGDVARWVEFVAGTVPPGA